MKIVNIYFNAYSDMASHFFAMSYKLASFGHEVTMIISNYHEDMKENTIKFISENENLNFKLHKMGNLKGLSLIRSCWQFFKYYIREKPDIVFCNDFCRSALWIAKLLNIKTCVILSGNAQIKLNRYKFCIDILACSKKYQVFVCKMILNRKEIVEWIPFFNLENNIKNIGINIDNKVDNLNIKNMIVFGAFGSFEDIEGFEELIVCAKFLKEQSIKCKFIVAGYGDEIYYNRLKKLIKILNIEEYVELIYAKEGYEKNYNYFWSNIDIYIYPSWKENEGTNLITAIQCHKPIIANNIGCVSDALYNDLFLKIQSKDINDPNLKKNFKNSKLSWYSITNKYKQFNYHFQTLPLEPQEIAYCCIYAINNMEDMEKREKRCYDYFMRNLHEEVVTNNVIKIFNKILEKK